MFAVEYEDVENPAVWPWIRYTPTISRSGTAFDVGSGTVKGFYRLEGDTLEMRWFIAYAADTDLGTGDIIVSLPSGFEIDPEKLNAGGWLERYDMLTEQASDGETANWQRIDCLANVASFENSNDAWAPEFAEFEISEGYLEGRFSVPVKDPYSVQ